MTGTDHGIRARLTRLREEPDRGGGSVSVLLVTLILAVPLSAGLIVDGGIKARALSRADNIAEEAARAGATGINIAALGNGTADVLDTAAAHDSASAYLTRAGVSGTVEIHGRSRLVVTVTITEPTVFLGVIGIDHVTSTGSGTAELLRT